MKVDTNDEMFLMRMLMAVVRKAGGVVTVTEGQVFDAGNMKFDFDPPLQKERSQAVGEQKITVTVSDADEADEEESDG